MLFTYILLNSMTQAAESLASNSHDADIMLPMPERPRLPHCETLAALFTHIMVSEAKRIKLAIAS